VLKSGGNFFELTDRTVAEGNPLPPEVASAR
jgi:hypothetical protein